MAMTPEGKVKNRVVALLKQAGNLYWFFPATHGYGRSGVPDIICCISGRFLAIECKAGKNPPTELQRREMRAIRGAGGEAVVVNEENLGALPELIDMMRSEYNECNQD